MLHSEDRPCLKMQRSGSEAVKNILNYVRKKIGLDPMPARAAQQTTPTAEKVAGEAKGRRGAIVASFAVSHVLRFLDCSDQRRLRDSNLERF